MRISALSLALAGLIMVAPAASRAADTSPGPAKSPLAPDWLVTVQFGPGLSPAYPGSSAYRPVPVPGLGVRRSDEPERFAAPDDGFGAPILDTAGFRLGPVANVLIPRWTMHQELNGLRKLSTAIEIGAYAEYYPVDDMRLRGELRQGVYGHDGLVATFGSDFIRRAGAFLFSAGPRINLGTAAYANGYFDVTPDQALANGRVPPFQSHGGVTSAGFMTTARYDFDPRWNATVYGGLQRLTGSPGASPIPNILGSRNQYSAGLMFARTFTIGGF